MEGNEKGKVEIRKLITRLRLLGSDFPELKTQTYYSTLQEFLFDLSGNSFSAGFNPPPPAPPQTHPRPRHPPKKLVFNEICERDTNECERRDLNATLNLVYMKGCKCSKKF